MEAMNTITAVSLEKQWDDLKKENPKLRIRNAAEQLGVSEAELLLTQVNDTVTPLDIDFADFLKKEVPKLGRVMALTRNNEVVHERKGTYLNPGFNSKHVGLFVGDDIDLRIFLMHWKYAFAVAERTQGANDRLSVQFFDKYGNAIHKIYLINQSNTNVFHDITKQYRSAGIDYNFEKFKLQPEARNELPDVSAFQSGWINLQDTHDFFPLLKKYKVSRLQSLELAPDGDFIGKSYAVEVKVESLRKVLDLAADRSVPIMVFVGNKGNLQIHTGPVKKIAEFGDWYNVLDPDFNLHINEKGIASAWVVRKPTEDGLVSSLELFNSNEDLVCTFFGKRKPGIPEDDNWRALIDDVAKSTLKHV